MNLGEFMKLVQYCTVGREELAFKHKRLEFWLLGTKSCAFWFTPCQRIQQKGWFALSGKLKTEEPEGTVIPSKGRPGMVRKRFCMPASCCPQQKLILKPDRWFYQVLIPKEDFPLCWDFFPLQPSKGKNSTKIFACREQSCMCLIARWLFDFSHRQQVSWGQEPAVLFTVAFQLLTPCLR